MQNWQVGIYTVWSTLYWERLGFLVGDIKAKGSRSHKLQSLLSLEHVVSWQDNHTYSKTISYQFSSDSITCGVIVSARINQELSYANYNPTFVKKICNIKLIFTIILRTCVWVNYGDEVRCAGKDLLKGTIVYFLNNVVLVLGKHPQLVTRVAIQTLNNCL